jgi:hypothetical protein
MTIVYMFLFAGVGILRASGKPQAASHKLQAASDKHLTNLDKGLYRIK